MECVGDVENMLIISKREDVQHVDLARQKKLKPLTGKNLDNKVIFSERDKY